MLRISWLFRPVVAAILLLLPGVIAAHAARIDHLYRAQVVVSGRGEENRAAGFAQCMQDVLVKLSGDQRLIGDPKVLQLAGKSTEFVSGFTYRDRLSGVPIHDEQGSYDRPHDLTVDFDPVKIDTALEQLGREPWLSQRPRLVVILNVEPRREKPFTLAKDSAGASDADMRFSLAAAAERVGMPMELPTSEENREAAGADVSPSVPEDGESVALTGTLTWSDAAKGWIADWRMAKDGKTHEWQLRGIGFDDAFRSGMRGAAQILSGNGNPA